MDTEKNSDEGTLASRVIQFPKAKKHGRKVCKGPIADVLVFPVSSDEALISEWAAMDRQARRPWQLAADADSQSEPLLEIELKLALAYMQCVGEQVMRREISEFRARQSKLGKLVDQLKLRGAQPEDLDAVGALLYLIDKNLIKMASR